MKNKIRFTSLAILISIIVPLVGVLAGLIVIKPSPAMAAGTSNMTINVSTDMIVFNSGSKLWSELVTGAGDTQGTSQTLIWTGAAPGGYTNKYWVKTPTLKFDCDPLIAAVAAGAEIKHIYINLTVNSKYLDAGAIPYYFFAKTTGGWNGWANYADYPHSRVSKPYSYWDFPSSGNISLEILDPNTGDYSYILDDSDGDVYFELIDYYLFSGNGADAAQPYFPWQPNVYYQITFDDIDDAGDNYAKMIVEYAAPAAERVMNELTNDADYPSAPTGSENVTGISWLTPRAAFADELLGFRVEGDPGAAFDYQLIDSYGTILDSGNNTIKVNDCFYWYYEPEINFTGWVKFQARNIWTSELTQSQWGRVESPPDSTQRNLSISAYDTYYPQFDNPFSYYWKYKNDVGYLFWKTNLEVGDMGDYAVQIFSGGDTEKCMYSANLSTLITDYFKINDSSNNYTAHWRYLMFTPFGSGINRYDEMITYLHKDYTLSNCGFWQGTIRQNSDNSTLVWTETADFYLSDINQGVSISIFDNESGDGLLESEINIGNHSKVAARLSGLEIQVLDALGEVYSTTDTFIIEGQNFVSFPQPESAGDYQARFTFYDDDLVPYYQYIRDVSFKLAVGGTGGITPGETPSASGFLAWLGGLLDNYGLDNTAGHWLIIILLLIIVAAVFGVYGKMPLVATVICMCIFGFALWAKWVDQWIIVLLAIAAGFTLWRMFRKQTGTSSEENPK